MLYYTQTTYKAMVKPILDYAAMVWSPHIQKNINDIERNQNKLQELH